MYDGIAEALARGDTVILDGGTGTDIQRRGVPMDSSTWCAEANLTHPDVVREVHRGYIAAGADIIIANTFATSALLFNALGRDAELIEIEAQDRRGVPNPTGALDRRDRPAGRRGDPAARGRRREGAGPPARAGEDVGA